MPAKSRRQQRYLYWKFGSRWVHKHHFANKIRGGRRRGKRRGR